MKKKSPKCIDLTLFKWSWWLLWQVGEKSIKCFHRSPGALFEGSRIFPELPTCLGGVEKSQNAKSNHNTQEILRSHKTATGISQEWKAWDGSMIWLICNVTRIRGGMPQQVAADHSGREGKRRGRVGGWVVGGCLCCVSLPPWGVGAISRMRPSVTIVKRTWLIRLRSWWCNMGIFSWKTPVSLLCGKNQCKVDL